MTQRIFFFLLAGVALFSACSTGPAEKAAQAELLTGANLPRRATGEGLWK